MPDIGATLRETRMRKRIDITQVEAATKIRAKYLRALENEEWDQLPGPTFVRTFLRTYGDYLGLDSKMLVEEYKQRFQQPTPQELLPFAPRPGGRRGRRTPGVPPIALVGLCVAALLAALFALGTWGDDPATDGRSPTGAEVTPVPGAKERGSAQERRRTRARRERRRERRAAAPSVVRLRITPTGVVNVCLVSAMSGKVLIPSQNLQAGATTRWFEAKRLRVTFGNGDARMSIRGRAPFDVPDTDEPIGYELRPGKPPRVLSADARPTCAPS